MRAIILALALVVGCAECHTAPASQTLTCEVVNSVVDCTTSNVISSVAAFEPLLNWVIGLVAAAGTPMDWPAFGVALAGVGLADAGCIAAQLENDIADVPASMPAGAKLRIREQTAASFDAWYQPWRAAHFAPAIKFKLADGSLR